MVIRPLTYSNKSGVRLSGTFHICYDHQVVVVGFFDRAKARCKAFATTFGLASVRLGYREFNTRGGEFSTIYKPVKTGRDRFIFCETINKKVGAQWVLTTKEDKYEDVYQFMMNKYKMPLLKEWIPYIVETAVKDRLVSEPYLRRETAYETAAISLHGRMVNVRDLVVVDLEWFSEKALQEIVGNGLKIGKIKISNEEQKPLKFEGFDDYVRTYGSSIVENLEKEMEPLSPLKGKVEAAAFYHKRMYPQQGACVNGIIALAKSNAKYAFVAEGMGCGKTLQGAAVADTYANEMWLKQNPGKTLKDCYESNEVAYRNILMAPSHLVEKWKSEIESEIPFAKCEIIKNFSQLVNLRARGRERAYGREWYLISKDFCKLGSQYSPIPHSTGSKYPVLNYCKDCHDERDLLNPMIIKKGDNKCSCVECGGTKAFKKEQTYYGKFRGMVCPSCGELLIKSSPKWYDGTLEEPVDYVLWPKNFASRNTFNSKCNCCGAPLWGVDSKPVDFTGQDFANVKRTKSAWRKVSHFSNAAKKSRTTAFVLRGHEDNYLNSAYTEGLQELGREYGPRKHAPAQFIKKYLKGYFDFCVLDECHKYENGGTAQTVAAQALVKASGFTLALTGTLTNGKADSLFYLLYLLEPQKMVKMGYTYNDVMAFCQKYGSVETVYEVDDSRGGYNKNSRGRQRQAPRIKPGISPLLVTDFLLERSVFLDLSDLSKYLPKLKEEVILVEPPCDIKEAYESTIDSLKEKARGGAGLGVMGKMLIFGLSYLDKPFGRTDIMSTTEEDTVLASVENFDEYEDKLLPKEEKLVELVNKEIGEGRNCFVYASYTGEAEQNVTSRLKNVIETNCNLKGQVLILESKSPKAEEREAFIKKKAMEGYRVIICNPKCVETGLDFCFWAEGKWYNYPTLIFYQISYELSVIWQASRRAYRLIQTEECRNYYLGYEGTLQAAALEIMAEKQVAASAVQGKFSAEGLSALAKGVDPRLKLAQMLSDGDMSSRKSLENMFDALNQTYEADDSAYGEIEKPQTYYEMMGIDPVANLEVIDIDAFITNADDSVASEESKVIEPTKSKTEETKSNDMFNSMSMFDLLGDIPMTFTFSEELLVTSKGNKKVKKEKKVEGQLSMFDLLAC